MTPNSGIAIAGIWTLAVIVSLAAPPFAFVAVGLAAGVTVVRR